MSNGRIVLLVALGAYALMSLITFAVYGFDKFRAARGGWRVRESHLHALALLGGWPGALLAQQVFRHKRRKIGFVLLTLLIAALHVAAWMWLWSRQVVTF
jgi:uncharacterized membrane protein YsdA (DUF1294 family)